MVYRKFFSTGLQFLGIFALGIFSTRVQNHGETQKLPGALPVLQNTSFVLAYDGRTKLPYWTFEHLTPESLEKRTDRQGQTFKQDKRLYPLHRSQISDYKDSGFDRGHMVPAADQLSSEQALKETFFLSNVCPQNSQLNRKLWAKLEKHIRSLVLEYENVDVVTGPLFLPTVEEQGKKFVHYEVIGENCVSVPTHFFKFIRFREQEWAYIIPNQAICDSGNLEQYLVSRNHLEKASGIVFD